MTWLPLYDNDITTVWLNEILRGDDAAVQDEAIDVAVDSVIRGSVTKVFVNATFASGAQRRFCLKGVFDDPRLDIRVFAARQEANFFKFLADSLDLPLFRTWFADANDDQGVVVFDDLSDAIRFNAANTVISADEVAGALEWQARWHAATYCMPQTRHAWLTVGNQTLQLAIDVMFAPEHWEQRMQDPRAVSLVGSLADRASMVSTFIALLDRQSTRPHALSHGDPHVGNTYIDENGEVGFYDWQTVCLAPLLDDVAYFVAGALTIDDRRRHEVDLLRHYQKALRTNGGPDLDWDDLWRDYRVQQFHGFVWAVMPTEWNPLDVSVPLAERYIAAIEDHDTVSALA